MIARELASRSSTNSGRRLPAIEGQRKTQAGGKSQAAARVYKETPKKPSAAAAVREPPATDTDETGAMEDISSTRRRFALDVVGGEVWCRRWGGFSFGHGKSFAWKLNP